MSEAKLNEIKIDDNYNIFKVPKKKSEAANPYLWYHSSYKITIIESETFS
jgi:hypothetical protein